MYHSGNPGAIYQIDWDDSFKKLPDLDPLYLHQPLEFVKILDSSDDELLGIAGPPVEHPLEQLPELLPEQPGSWRSLRSRRRDCYHL